MSVSQPDYAGFYFHQAEDGIRERAWSGGVGDVHKRQTYRQAPPSPDTTGLTPIDSSITDPLASRFVDPSPLPGQDGHYAVVAVDAAGNALSAVQSTEAPGPTPLSADSFETGDLSNWSSLVQ